MEWIEIKRVLDKAADELYDKCVAKVNSVGFPFRDEDSLEEVMPAAKTFLFNESEEYHHEGRMIEGGQGQAQVLEPVYTRRAEYEDSFHMKKEVTQLVDDILKKNDISIPKNGDEYKGFCRQTLEMLYRLDKKNGAH